MNGTADANHSATFIIIQVNKVLAYQGNTSGILHLQIMLELSSWTVLVMVHVETGPETPFLER